ncbi:MAG: precorrin-2 C(20)-methyltransferase, partial [Victivallales bacterium]|nr:precorrin-2 C(20)-methyltransferase [Victivallales bacterium]
LDGVTAPVTELSFPMGRDREERQRHTATHAERLAALLAAGKNCAFATIGDPSAYSTCGYLAAALRKLLPEVPIEIIPGVNSWSALAAAAGQVLAEDREELRIVPGYIAPETAALDRLLAGGEAVVLLKTYRSRNRLVEELQQRRIPMVYGANLGLPEQFVSSDPEAIKERPTEYLSLLLVPPHLREDHD